MMKHFISALFLTPLFLSSAAIAEPKPIGVRGLALERGTPLPERYVRVKEGYAPLTFLYAEPAELIISYANPAIILFDKKQNEKGEEVYVAANQIPTPAGTESALILGWMDGEKARYLAVNDDFTSAKYNDWLMINTSSKQIAFQIGKDSKPLSIKPSSADLHRISAPENKGAAIKGFYKYDDQIKNFYSTYWSVREKERSILIFFDRENKLAVRRISDKLFVPKEEKDQ